MLISAQISDVLGPRTQGGKKSAQKSFVQLNYSHEVNLSAIHLIKIENTFPSSFVAVWIELAEDEEGNIELFEIKRQFNWRKRKCRRRKNAEILRMSLEGPNFLLTLTLTSIKMQKIEKIQF